MIEQAGPAIEAKRIADKESEILEKLNNQPAIVQEYDISKQLKRLTPEEQRIFKAINAAKKASAPTEKKKASPSNDTIIDDSKAAPELSTLDKQSDKSEKNLPTFLDVDEVIETLELNDEDAALLRFYTQASYDDLVAEIKRRQIAPLPEGFGFNLENGLYQIINNEKIPIVKVPKTLGEYYTYRGELTNWVEKVEDELNDVNPTIPLQVNKEIDSDGENERKYEIIVIDLKRELKLPHNCIWIDKESTVEYAISDEWEKIKGETPIRQFVNLDKPGHVFTVYYYDYPSSVDRVVASGSDDPNYSKRMEKTSHITTSWLTSAEHHRQLSEEIKKVELTLPHEWQEFIRLAIALVNQKRIQCGMPQRIIALENFHILKEDDYKRLVDERSVGRFSPSGQMIFIQLNANPIEFAGIILHEIIHACSYSVDYYEYDNDKSDDIFRFITTGLRKKLTSQEEEEVKNFIILEETMTEKMTHEILNDLAMRELPLLRAAWQASDRYLMNSPDKRYDQPSLNVRRANEWDNASFDSALAVAVDSSGELIGNSYTFARRNLEHLINLLEKNSHGKTNKQLFERQLMKAKFSGDWREIMRLFDDVWGEKAASALAKASRKSETFASYVQDMVTHDYLIDYLSRYGDTNGENDMAILLRKAGLTPHDWWTTDAKEKSQAREDEPTVEMTRAREQLKKVFTQIFGEGSFEDFVVASTSRDEKVIEGRRECLDYLHGYDLLKQVLPEYKQALQEMLSYESVSFRKDMLRRSLPRLTEIEKQIEKEVSHFGLVEINSDDSDRLYFGYAIQGLYVETWKLCRLLTRYNRDSLNEKKVIDLLIGNGYPIVYVLEDVYDWIHMDEEIDIDITKKMRLESLQKLLQDTLGKVGLAALVRIAKEEDLGKEYQYQRLKKIVAQLTERLAREEAEKKFVAETPN